MKESFHGTNVPTFRAPLTREVERDDGDKVGVSVGNVGALGSVARNSLL